MKLLGDDKLPALMQSLCDIDGVAISEQDFVTRYLPMFANVNNRQDVDLTPWLEITNPCAPVRVHSNTDVNDILFTVPPLLDTRATPFLHGEEKPSISSLVYKAEQLNIDRPGHGSAYLDNNLKGSVVSSDIIRLDIAAQWNYIFERYGLPVMAFKGKSISGGSSDSIKPAHVDDVYEDL